METPDPYGSHIVSCIKRTHFIVAVSKALGGEWSSGPAVLHQPHLGVAKQIPGEEQTGFFEDGDYPRVCPLTFNGMIISWDINGIFMYTIM